MSGEPQKCPSCNANVGVPVGLGKPNQHVEIDENMILICAKCFEFLRGQKNGGIEIMDSRMRGQLLIIRGAEMCRMLSIAAMAAQADQAGRN